MRVGSKGASDRSLTQRLVRAFAAVSVLIIATLVVTGGCFAAVLGHFEPSVNSLLTGRDAIDQVQNGMLGEETGIRGYLSSGDQVFLSAYYAGQISDPARRRRISQARHPAGPCRSDPRHEGRPATLVQRVGDARTGD